MSGPDSLVTLEHALHELRVHQAELLAQNEELRRTQTALEASQARYFELYDLAPVGYLTIDAAGVIVEANLTAATQLGVERAGLVSSKITRFVFPADQDVYERKRRALFNADEEYVCDLRLVRKEDKPVWVRLQAAPATDAKGARTCRMVLSDISERVVSDLLLAQADRVSSMGMIAAGIAHEINNPLAYVLLNVDSLVRELPPMVLAVDKVCARLRDEPNLDEQERAAVFALDSSQMADALSHAKLALDGLERIRGISSALGAFSRVDSAEHGAVDVRSAIESALRLSGNEIKYRARLRRELSPVPMVWASEGKLAQVFLNLILNAAHAVGEGHHKDAHIKIRTWASGADVFSEISDTGAGISEENLARIFDPFFTTKPAGLGTGLGLSICKRIVEELGGRLHIESTKGVGTSVTVRLPALAEGDARLATASRPAPSDAENLHGPRGRILIVDDEEEIRRVTTRMLACGHDVVEAPSGTAARALLETDTAFDVILCDLMMTELLGVDLHAWLVDRNPALAKRIVFVTGGSFLSSTTDYLEKVGNPVLKKPFRREELLHLVARVMSTATSSEPP